MENLLYLLINFVIMGLFFFVMAAIFLFMLRKNQKWIAAIAAGFIYCAVLAAGVYTMGNNLSGQGMSGYMAGYMQKQIDTGLAEAGKKGASAEELSLLKTSAETFIVKPLPAWMLISTAFLVFLVYFIVRLYALNKYGIDDGMPPFELWRIPEPVIWALIACMSALVFSDMIKSKPALDIAYNGAFILGSVYFTSGLSVVSYYFIKYKVSWPAKFFFYLMLVLWSFLGIIIILAGTLDTWFNFRKLEKGA